METLQRLLDGLWNGFWGLIDWLEPIIRSLAELMFDTEIPPGGAQGVTVALVVLFGAWLIGKFFNSVTKSAANQPMKITLSTDKTPAQVVGESLSKQLRALVLFALTVAALYMVGSAVS